MGEIWGPVVGSLGFVALIVIPIVVNKIIKFKLEIAKINAETTIRTEEIRARNQLEIEKLMEQEEKRQNKEKLISGISDFHEKELLGKPNNSRVHSG